MPEDVALVPGELARWIVAAWVGLLGAMLGSFLNVVVYRVPAGRSIVWPGSACPHCKHPVRWFDNVPVLSWLVLRGKCRDCEAPISSRYPLVEAAVGIAFLLLAWCDFIGVGASLGSSMFTAEGLAPIAAASHDPTPVMAPDDATLLVLLAWHAVLVYSLFGAALMEYDGHLAPRFLSLAMLVGLLLPVFWIGLQPAWPGGIPGMKLASTELLPRVLAAAANLALSVVAVGAGLVFRARYSRRGRRSSVLAASAVAVGLAVGWIASSWILAAAIVIESGVTCLFARRWRGICFWPATGWLVAVTLAWIVAGLGPRAESLGLLRPESVVVVVGLSWLASWIDSKTSGIPGTSMASGTNANVASARQEPVC